MDIHFSCFLKTGGSEMPPVTWSIKHLLMKVLCPYGRCYYIHGHTGSRKP